MADDITKAEGRAIAKAILVGLVSNPRANLLTATNPEGFDTPEALAKIAVDYADALIKELEVHQWPLR